MAVSEAVEQATFYLDLGNPGSYLVAERVLATMPVATEWIPVREVVLDPGAPERAPDLVALRARAAALGLLPLRWPSVWPQDTSFAMLAATYARQIGRTVAFCQAAFRQTFAGGRDLGDENTVLIAAAACEMHPAAVLKSTSLRSVASRLAAATEQAAAQGVTTLPAIVAGERVFTGEDAPERAATALGAAR